MIRNYLRVAMRNLLKHKVYSAINIFGLAVGIACCIVMLLYVRDEMTFDAFHSKADRIYRILATKSSPEQEDRVMPYSMGPIGQALVSELPELEASVRLRDTWGTGRFTVGYGERKFYEGDYIISEPSFFDLFDFTMVKGDKRSALLEPNSVVLTKAAALKYFGAEDPMGKTLYVERPGDAKVTGILEDPPKNSHLQFSMIFSLSTLESNPRWKQYIDSWESDGFITYIRTREGVVTTALQQKLTALIESRKSAVQKGLTALTAQPLRDIHFGSGNVEFDRNSGKSEITYVLVFSLIAVFILLIGCINYTNLATARAMKRGREIGMRKVVGASRSQLVIQLLGESILLSLFALLLGLALAEFVLPGFNALAGKELALALHGNIPFLIALLIVAMTVGVLSGGYPALYLAGLNPVRVLKTQASEGTRGVILRRVLVVTQFSLSIIMIIATVVAMKQLEYIRQRNLGFNQDQLLVVDINSGNTRRSFEAIKTEMLQLSEVSDVSVSSRVPGEWKNIAEIDVVPSGRSDNQTFATNFICVDEDFLGTFQMQLTSGRNLSSAMGADSASVLVNEAGARMYGWDDPVGKEVFAPGVNYRARVVGVVRDFHFRSLHEPIGPLLLGHWNNPIVPIDYFTLRVSTEDYSSTLSSLERIHTRFDKVTPLEYNFLDERINDFYKNDRRVSEIFSIAAVLAIMIACLGLLGLVSFTAEQRTKEIGIRKVLGASAPNILLLLSQDFALLVGVATAIATPVAYLTLQAWLEDFAYRISIGPGVFLLAGLIALLIALCTVSFQTVRAAMTNPVKSLRYE